MWQSTWFHVKEISIFDHVDSTLQLHRITLTQSSDLSSKRFLEENILLNHKMEAGVSAIWNSQFRSCVDLTLKQHRKIHVEKSSIFHRFWKSNRREVIHVESMSSFSREFAFHNWWNIIELSSWNFDIKLMSYRRRCVHWCVSIVYFEQVNAGWYISPSLALVLTTETLSLITFTISHSFIHRFNIMLLWQYLAH